MVRQAHHDTIYMKLREARIRNQESRRLSLRATVGAKQSSPVCSQLDCFAEARNDKRAWKMLIKSLAVVATVMLFLLPQLAFAADDPGANELMQNINEIVNLILRFVSALLWPVLMLIGSLMDNDLIFGGAMGERLREVWVQMRNFVNIIFVIVLLAVALYNVLGIGEDGGPLALKTVLPKFVLALIAVNFSFFGIRVVLDFTNVITGAVFALPATVSDQRFSSDKIEKDICETNSNEMPMKRLWCKENKFNDRAKSFFAKFDRTNVAMIYAIKFGKAHSLKFIKGGLKSIGQLAFNVLFNTLLFVVYALSFIALFLVLLGRVVALWIAVVLSPLLALSIVVPQLKELAGGAGELQTKFVKSAVAPITIGLVLSVGYIMLEGFGGDKSIHGELLSSSTLEAIDPNALPTDITDLQQLMIAIGVIVIVWTGVFDAAKGTVAETITESIRSKAVDFGKFMAKLPTYAQVIPTGGKFGNVSAATLGRTFSDIPGYVAGKRAKSLLYPENEDVIAAIGHASTPRDVGKAASKDLNTLSTPKGWEALSKKKGLGWNDPADFNEKFKGGPNDPTTVRALATLLERQTEFMAGVQEKSPEIKGASELAEAIMKKPTTSITDVTSFVTTVMGADSDSAKSSTKVDPAVQKAIPDIKNYSSGLGSGITEMFFEGSGDGDNKRIKFKSNYSVDTIKFARDVKTAVDSNANAADIGKAVSAASAVDKKILEKIINDSSSATATTKTAAQKAANITPATK